MAFIRRSFSAGLGLAALLALGFAGAAAADTLKRIEDSGVIRIGHRTDALPHSYVDSSGRPAGYIVDLCREVVVSVQQRLKPAPVRAEFVVITAQDRFAAVRENRIDLLCEPSSITMSRREIVDFSIPTFVDGAGVAFRGAEIERFEDFAGRKVGVLGGTTSHNILRSALFQLGARAEIVVAEDHRSGIGMLAESRLDAYFADHAILAYYARQTTGQSFRIGRRHFSYETYGLAFQRGDDGFRLLVDRTLARLAREGRIHALASRNFTLSDDALLRTLIAINSLPD